MIWNIVGILSSLVALWLLVAPSSSKTELPPSGKNTAGGGTISLNLTGSEPVEQTLARSMISGLNQDAQKLVELVHFKSTQAFRTLPSPCLQSFNLLYALGGVLGVAARDFILKDTPLPKGQSLFVALLSFQENDYEVIAFIAPTPG